MQWINAVSLRARLHWGSDLNSKDTAEYVMQDLPVGIHGTFPVKFNGAAIMGSGGIQAAYSQSQHALAYVF